MRPVVENKVWYLRQNRLFESAGDETVDASQHLFETCLYPRKSYVFDQGDSSRLVYLVKRGKVRLTRLTSEGKEVTVAVLGAGDLFGEETLFASTPRTTHAVCIEETLLCSAKADDLFSLLSETPTLALNVAKVLSDKLLDASATMEDLAYANVPDRILHALARLGDEHGIETPAGVLLNLRLTHADIASLIGSTRETVSLELSQLIKAGRVAFDGKHLTLPR